MAKVFRIVAAAITVTVIASLIGCSQEPNSSTATSQKPSATENAASNSSSSPEAQNYRVVKDITLPSPGADPMAMVFQIRKTPTEPTGAEQLKVSYPAADRAVVVSIVSGMQDDSVSAIRTRYDFQSVEGSAEGHKLWEVTKVTQQNKCQAGRGSEKWTGELCK